MSTKATTSTGRVVWINGAFGAGKTTAARLLAEAIPGSVIVDPEEVGSLLRPVLQPVAPVRDFQEWHAWRVLVAATLNAIVHELPDDGPRLAIVPQTITNETYWQQITSAINPGIDLTPIALHVTTDEHHRRVISDAEEPGAQRWRLSRFEQFHSADWLQRSFTGIDTSNLTPEQVTASARSVLQI